MEIKETGKRLPKGGKSAKCDNPRCVAHKHGKTFKIHNGRSGRCPWCLSDINA